jgi:OOP family OmpA-OmpF porin
LEKNMKLVKTLGALSLVGFAAVSGQAAVAAESGWYLGLGVGQSAANIADDRIRNQLSGVSVTTTIDDDDRDFGYKLFGGYKFNKNFALEGGYFNLGEFGFTANTTPAGTFTGTGKFQGLNLDAIGILPFTEKFSAFGRVGYIYTETKDTFTGTGGGSAVAAANPDPDEKAGNYKYGLGVQYDFTQALGLRVEWERYRVKDAVGNKGDIDMALIGLVYTFGAKPAARAATPPPPAYVAPVAAAPVLVIVPVVARTQQYCSILDIQFEVNQNTVQRESEEKLDKVVTFMRKYPDTTAVIEGHTDEVGTSAENMRLSQSRAESMVSYLASRGIARSRLQAVGYGETRPIADNSTEVGRRLNRRINSIIACTTDIEGIVPAPARVTMALEMEFDTNSANIRQQDREGLLKVANFLKGNPRVTATVEGHTSNQQGTPAQAMQLSQRRAEHVVNALVNLGVDRARLSAAGFGDTRRFAYNTSAEGRQENRRINIILDFPN